MTAREQRADVVGQDDVAALRRGAHTREALTRLIDARDDGTHEQRRVGARRLADVDDVHLHRLGQLDVVAERLHREDLGGVDTAPSRVIASLVRLASSSSPLGLRSG